MITTYQPSQIGPSILSHISAERASDPSVFQVLLVNNLISVPYGEWGIMSS
jgi:hypothetical protein